MNDTPLPAPHLCDTPSLTTPFENIALALSGGGFRSAAFALGLLSYLDSVSFADHTAEGAACTLLKKVKYISSASGGTITNTLYTLCSVRGTPVQDFYKAMFAALDGEKLLTVALQILDDKKKWSERPHKSRNIINAFAMAYDTDYLFKGATLGEIEFMQGSISHTHLEEVCYNTTEFYMGQCLHQQVKTKADAMADAGFYYGNYYVQFDKQTHRQLKLADVLAASSCFPAGFEPIIYPTDFSNGTNNADNYEELKANLLLRENTNSKNERDVRHSRTIGCMDGGITDNQGLESLMMADTRRICGNTSFKRFDLVMVNDVGSFYMDAYVAPQMNHSFWTRPSFNFYRVLITAICLLSLAGIVWAWQCRCPWQTAALIASSIVFGITALLVIAGLVIKSKIFGTTAEGGKKKAKGAKALNLAENFSPQIIDKLTGYLNNIRIRVTLRLLQTRLKSVLTLNNDVFLKRIRQILYNRFYDSPVWKYRRKANHIYDLANANNINRERQDSKYTPEERALINPTPQMQSIADHAYEMPTTLWFDTEQQKNEILRDIIACGQFSACNNLVRYIIDLRKEPVYQTLDAGYRKRVDDIYKTLLQHWERFKTEPYFLYNEIKQA